MKEKEDEIKKSSVANKPKPLKKLKPIPQNNQKKTPEPEKKTKRIVIGDLPDYDSLEETPVEEIKEEVKSEPEKTKKSEKTEKKGFFSRVKDLMYVSADDDEEEKSDDEDESEELQEEEDNISFTVEEITENVPDTMDIVNEVLSESKNKTPEPEPETIPEQEQKPIPSEETETKPQQSSKNNNKNRKKKKNRNKNKNKKSGAGNSGKPEQEEKKQEEISEPEEEKISDEPQIKETETEPEQEIISDEVTEEEIIKEEVTEDVPEISEDAETSEEKTVTVKNGKYSILALLCVILAIIGVVAIINTCISGGSSSNDKYKKAVYPAVITDISPFEDPAELSDNQILSSAIWSVILDKEKLSQYPQRIDNMAIIPAEDIENIAKDIFGDDMRELTHSTITTADSRFYYNEEANSYSVDIKPYTFTYSPEIKSVSKKNGKYIVEVDYIAEHPEWMEEDVSKSAEFTLSKNGNSGYTIASMREIIPE